MIVLQRLSYIHPSGGVLFADVNLTVNKLDKIAIVGNNGAGKSTLLKIICGDLQSSSGKISVEKYPYFIPQIFGQYNHLTVAQALGVHGKLHALNEILSGHATEDNIGMLDDDWTIEDRIEEALVYWQLESVNPGQTLESLSGGQKTKLFLAGITIHQPELVLMDEPTNHLDASSRALLYDFIETTKATLVIVTHDRSLLNVVARICELAPAGIKVYSGNYEFYQEQKQIENDSLNRDILNKEKMLKKSKEKQRETMERKQKLDARGKGKQEKGGVARIMMNTLRNNAENSTARLSNAHTEKINGISKDLHDLRASVPDIDKMRFGFKNSTLHTGKTIFVADDINFRYDANFLWKENLSFRIVSGERVVLKGNNGAGKTTLIRLITGELPCSIGQVSRAASKFIYIDQDYSLIDNLLTVYAQAQTFNTTLHEHEVKVRLSRFLFYQNHWDKPCAALSGGERMRLMLCCLTISEQEPDLIFLDEPTNNLDIQNLEILTAAINEYQGTLIVVSHDELFLRQINVCRTIALP